MNLSLTLSVSFGRGRISATFRITWSSIGKKPTVASVAVNVNGTETSHRVVRNGKVGSRKQPLVSTLVNHVLHQRRRLLTGLEHACQSEHVPVNTTAGRSELHVVDVLRAGFAELGDRGGGRDFAKVAGELFRVDRKGTADFGTAEQELPGRGGFLEKRDYLESLVLT